MPNLAFRLPHFLSNFPQPGALPPGIEAQNPFRAPAVQALAHRFADKCHLMQYRRRDLEANVAKYVETLGSLL